MRIMIADDDPISRKIVQSALVGAGHEVRAFEDGADLLVAFEDSPVPVIVSDWLMPKLSGIELCRRVRALPGIPYTHVALVTTLAPGEHMVEAFRAGVDDFFSKPIDRELLTSRIAAAGRASMRNEELALRAALEHSQTVLGPENTALGDLLDELTSHYRRQRSFTRCRAFLRRHLAMVEAAGDAASAARLRGELAEVDAQEEIV